MLDSTVLVGHCDLKQSLLHASVQIALTLELIWSFRNHSDFHGKAECPLVLIKSLEHKVFVHLNATSGPGESDLVFDFDLLWRSPLLV